MLQVAQDSSAAWLLLWNGIWSFQSGVRWSPFRGGRPFLDGNGTDACEPASFDPTQCVNRGGDYNLDGIANDRSNAISDHVNATHSQWGDGFNLPRGFFTAPCLGCVGNRTSASTRMKALKQFGESRVHKWKSHKLALNDATTCEIGWLPGWSFSYAGLWFRQ